MTGRQILKASAALSFALFASLWKNLVPLVYQYTYGTRRRI